MISKEEKKIIDNFCSEHGFKYRLKYDIKSEYDEKVDAIIFYYEHNPTWVVPTVLRCEKSSKVLGILDMIKGDCKYLTKEELAKQIIHNLKRGKVEIEISQSD